MQCHASAGVREGVCSPHHDPPATQPVLCPGIPENKQGLWGAGFFPPAGNATEKRGIRVFTECIYFVCLIYV